MSRLVLALAVLLAGCGGLTIAPTATPAPTQPPAVTPTIAPTVALPTPNLEATVQARVLATVQAAAPTATVAPPTAAPPTPTLAPQRPPSPGPTLWRPTDVMPGDYAYFTNATIRIVDVLHSSELGGDLDSYIRTKAFSRQVQATSIQNRPRLANFYSRFGREPFAEKDWIVIGIELHNKDVKNVGMKPDDLALKAIEGQAFSSMVFYGYSLGERLFWPASSIPPDNIVRFNVAFRGVPSNQNLVLEHTKISLDRLIVRVAL